MLASFCVCRQPCVTEAAMSVLKYFKTIEEAGIDACPQAAIVEHSESKIRAKLRMKIQETGIGWKEVFMIVECSLRFSI